MPSTRARRKKPPVSTLPLASEAEVQSVQMSPSSKVAMFNFFTVRVPVED